MKRFVFAAALAVLPVSVFAQTSRPQPEQQLVTTPGHEVAGGLVGYNYVEPGDLQISIHGVKFTGELTSTFALSQRRHWFLQADFRGTTGSTSYDGWCAPWVLTPDSRSPNGYSVDVGDYSPCNDTGDPDWYVEGRALTGRDFVGSRWAWSPHAGVGVRHLSNGFTDVPGYRIDDYLYLPLGLTVRTAVSPHRVLSFTFEYDQLLHGWQNTHNSKLGGGDVDATATAPAFTINSMSDLSFDQSQGSAVRVSGRYQISPRWTVEPYWIYWHVSDSTIDYSTVSFTVNGITAQEQLGAVEPRNTTNEYGVKLHFRIR